MQLALVLALTAADPIFYALQLERPDGVKGSVVLNGVVIHSFEDQGTLSSALNAWLLPIGNTLEIKLEASKKLLSKDALLQAFVPHGVRGKMPDDLPKSAELAWHVGDGLPKTLSARFDAPDAPPHLLWQKAVVTPLDELAKKEIRVLVKALHTAMSKHDVPAMKSLLAFRMQDMARSMGEPAESGGEMVDWMLESLPKNAKPAPLPKLEFTALAGGKLIRVSGPKGIAPVIIKRDHGQLAMDTLFAKIDGRWTLVRCACPAPYLATMLRPPQATMQNVFDIATAVEPRSFAPAPDRRRRNQ